MSKRLFLSTAVAAGLLFAAAVPSANAAPLPNLAPGAAPHVLAEKAAWSCGPRRCVWVPGYRGPIPEYAWRWGPPRYANCYWKRGPLGRWKQKCDD